MLKITIRKASEKDIDNIEKGIRASWDLHAKVEPTLFDLERIKSSNVQKYYKEALTNKDSVVLIAEVNGTFAGFVKADTETIPHWFQYNTTFWIDDIYVNDEYRRKGIARKLIQEIEQEAKKRGIKRMQGRIYKFNIPMQNLLSSLGYDFPHMTTNKILK